MASEDVYLRKDVYEADQRALIAEIRLGNNEILRVFGEFREEVNNRFNKFEHEVNGRFDKLESRVDVLAGRVDGLERTVDRLDRRIDRIEGYVGTGIAFIAMLVTVVVFIAPISRLVRKIFRPEPTITLEQIEALIDAKLSGRK